MIETPLRKIDCHVHLLGDGSSGSGCWLRMRTLVQRLMARIIVHEPGLLGMWMGFGG